MVHIPEYNATSEMLEVAVQGEGREVLRAGGERGRRDVHVVSGARQMRRDRQWRRCVWLGGMRFEDGTNKASKWVKVSS
jgi:hypothetical protein